jgi:hypothetical protein
VRGLIENQPTVAADPLGAEWLEGWVPTERGARVRGGRTRAAYVTDAVKTLHPYIDSIAPEFFAATADAIYNISSLNPTTAPAPIGSGYTSGDWSSQQIGTSGGDFLFFCNGEDFTQIYDGGDLNPIADEAISDLAYDALTADFEVGETVTDGTASATIFGVVRTSATTGTLKIGTVTGGPFTDNATITSASGSADADGAESSASVFTITGVDTDTLSHPWLYQNRMFFIQKDTLKAWYLPAGSVGGAALDINLAGVFRRGGSLLFGATWATDSGAVLDDKCVFISTEGEVAIYSGTDPSSINTWGLQGRYDIGKPIGKRGSVNIGGDLLIATDDGIVPLSAAITKDPAELTLAAATRNIKTTWARTSRTYGANVELLKWTDQSLLLALFPGASRLFTANVLTGAWGTQVGWSGDCIGAYLGSVYVGRSDGRIYKIDDSGADDGAVFLAQACWPFSDLGDASAYKVASMARASWFAVGSFAYQLSVATDYQVRFPTAPNAMSDTGSVLVWDSGNWDEVVWGSDQDSERLGRVDLWRSVTGQGYAMAPMVQVASSGPVRIEAELISVDLLLSGGGKAA